MTRLRQHQVATGVPVAVVDALEVIDVHDHQCVRFIESRLDGRRGFEEGGARVQSRERVARRTLKSNERLLVVHHHHEADG